MMNRNQNQRLVVDEASYSWTRRANRGIPYFVFDLRTIASETDRNRLKSAGSFVLAHEFDQLNIENPRGLPTYQAHFCYGLKSFRTFLGAKMMVTSMLGFENYVTRHNIEPNVSDELLNFLITEYVELKDKVNIVSKEPKHLKGIWMSAEMLKRGLLLQTNIANSPTCAICQKDMTPQSTIYKLHNCVHVFHQPCIFKWLRRKTLCPICRIAACSAASQFPTWIRDLGMLREFLFRRHLNQSLNNSRLEVAIISIINSLALEYLDGENFSREVQFELFKKITDAMGAANAHVVINMRKEVGAFLLDCSRIHTDDTYRLSERFNSYIEKMMGWVQMSPREGAQFVEFKRDQNMSGEINRSSLKLLIRFLKGVNAENLLDD